MFLLIDNYDSFTFNLVQAFSQLGLEPLVLKNDDPAILQAAENPALQMVCISPGPGHPSGAGLCLKFLEMLNPAVPVLGVCLGHQILGLYGGAKIDVAPRIMHGKQSEVSHNGEGLFYGLPNPLPVARYHSLVIREESLGANRDDWAFSITARGPEGEVMAIAYRDRPWVGVQFHPESILTPAGLRLLENFPGAILGREDESCRMSAVMEQLARGEDLSPAQANGAFGALMDGRLSPAQAGAFLMGLRIKGESAQELAQASRAAVSRALRVEVPEQKIMDVVGTGGDGKNSFNCSTFTALTLAGMGFKVVKHGNRAVSSGCGSADVLEGLGFPLEKDPSRVASNLDRCNFAFLFAPHFHPAFKNIGPIRRELGIRTLFNLLGPLINPARPSHMLVGVPQPELVNLVAETLAASSIERAAVVCGAGGYDEITPIGPAKITLINGVSIGQVQLNPADYGILSCSPEELAVHDRTAAVAVMQDLLRGRGSRAMLDMGVLNVGVALYVLEAAPDLESCMELGREAVCAGAGGRVLDAA